MSDIDYARPALNCSMQYNPNDNFCSRCGSPMRLHHVKGCSLDDVGFVRGDHPAWVTVVKQATKAEKLQAIIDAYELDYDSILHAASFLTRSGYSAGSLLTQLAVVIMQESDDVRLDE